MGKYIFTKVYQLAIVLFGVTFLTFAITKAAPSDPAEMRYLSMGITPSPELLEQTRIEMGLDKPFLVQYGNWLLGVLHGDLGVSTKYSEPVFTQMTKKIPGTLVLAGVSGLLMVAISFPIGILTAVKKNKFIDYFIRVITFIGMSMPNFWLGLMLMYLFCVQLGWLSVISVNNPAGLILPVATLVIHMASVYIRHIRTSILEEMNSNYVIGARARGIPERKIMWGHIIPNALPTIITLIGLSIGGLLGGSAIIETLFSWQGIGNMVVEAIRVRDYQLIQGYVIWMAIIYVVVNLIVDILYRVLDPQLRLKRRVD